MTTPFRVGDFLPWFDLMCSSDYLYHFDTLGGRQVALAFLGGQSKAESRTFAKTMVALRPKLKDLGVHPLMMSSDPDDRQDPAFKALSDYVTTFWDEGGEVHRRYRLDQRPGLFLVARNLRLHAYVDLHPLETFESRALEAAKTFPERGEPLAEPAPAPMHAPVLQVSRVFDPELCQELIRYYETHGGAPSGFMRDKGGMTGAVLDPKFKRRADCSIADAGLVKTLHLAIRQRLIGEIRKAYAFEVTRVERTIIGCYTAEDRGFFSAHRDNTTKATKHRRFAVSINLNAEEFEGGELWFPEYADRIYKPGSGDAVVFSCSLLHEARPVTAGRRLAFLPFLYDEAAAKIRTDNRQFLSVPDAEMVKDAALAPPAEAVRQTG